jgi:cell division control protein 6
MSINTKNIFSNKVFKMAVDIDDVIEKGGIFKNKTVLKPNYTPESINDVLHRDDQIRAYYELMKDIFRPIPSAPPNLFVYGKPGLGKTLLTKLAFQVISRKAEAVGVDLLVITVNCDVAGSEHGVLQKIVADFPTPNNEPKKKLGYSVGRHNEYLKYLVDNYSGIIIIILDEIDKVEIPKIVNRIIRFESKKSRQFPTVVGITNETKLIDNFPPELKSVICENSLQIPPYDAEQLSDILKLRAKQAFNPGTIGEMVIPLAAAFAAQEHGDARRAINLLRVGGDIAEQDGCDMVHEEHIRKADEKIDADQTIEVVKTLPNQSKVSLFAIIQILDRRTKTDLNTIYALYMTICRELDLDILSHRRITALIDEMSQLGVLRQEVISKGRYGRKKIILSVASKGLVKETLLEDYRLKPLAEVDMNNFILPFRRAFE